MIETFKTDRGIETKLAGLKPWDKNPRNVNEEDYERLDSQLKLGVYKPLLVFQDGTVIGGNTRLRKYQDNGVENVWITTLEAIETEAGFVPRLNGKVQDEHKTFTSIDDMLFEYALSDNDQIGYYDHDMIANMMPNYDIEFEAFNLHFTTGDNMLDLILGEDEEPEEKATEQKFKVVIGCATVQEADKISKELSDLGYKCRVK